MDDLKALPATEGWAGIESSTGKITLPEHFKGVAIDELCKLAVCVLQQALVMPNREALADESN